MGQYEDENPTRKYTLNPNVLRTKTVDGEGLIPERLTAPKTTTAEHFTVVYFMPDGDAIIRYEKGHGTNTHLQKQAFAVIKVVPGTNREAPRLEFIKCRENLNDLFTSATNALIQTSRIESGIDNAT